MAFAQNDVGDGGTFTGARTANIPTYRLLGGKYWFTSTAASSSIVLNILMPDNTTYQAVGSSTTLTTSAANAVVDLPPCTVQFILVATADVAGGIVKIPYSGGMGF